MSDDKEVCDLCGLTVEVDSFELKTLQGDKRFCCEGCLGIYQMLNEDDIVSIPDSTVKNSGVNYQ